MKSFLISFAFTLAFASCVSDVPQPVKDIGEAIGIKGKEIDEPGLEKAKWFVWSEYGETSVPPKVLIVEEKDFECQDERGHGGFCVILKDGMGCRQGYTLSPFEVSIAYYPGRSFSEVGILAHEYMHAHQSRHGVFQADHNNFQGQDWGAGGLMDRANKLLKENGL